MPIAEAKRKVPMSEMLYRTTATMNGPWLVDVQALNSIDELLDTELEKLNVMVQREMEKPGSGDKVVNVCQHGPIYRLRANPERGKTGRHRAAPPSVLAPGPALGSCRHGALSSAQAILHRSAVPRVGQCSRRNHIAGRLASRAALLLSRAASSLRSRSAKISLSRPANLAAGAT